MTVTLTTAAPKPSTTTFEAPSRDPVCTRHRIALVRVATTSHPEGVVVCPECRTAAKAGSEVVTYAATLLLRNR